MRFFVLLSNQQGGTIRLEFQLLNHNTSFHAPIKLSHEKIEQKLIRSTVVQKTSLRGQFSQYFQGDTQYKSAFEIYSQ